MNLTHAKAMTQPATIAAPAGLRMCDQAGYEAASSGQVGFRTDPFPPPR